MRSFTSPGVFTGPPLPPAAAIGPFLPPAAAIVVALAALWGCTFTPPATEPISGLRFSAMKELPSPNFEPRPEGAVIDMLVIHYTGMESADAALSRMNDAKAKVSAHYVIDEEGTVWRLVAEKMRAWHAGIAAWRGDDNIN